MVQDAHVMQQPGQQVQQLTEDHLLAQLAAARLQHTTNLRHQEPVYSGHRTGASSVIIGDHQGIGQGLHQPSLVIISHQQGIGQGQHQTSVITSH